MVNWINIAKDNYYDHLSKLDEDTVSTEWSSDKKTCTYSLKGVQYLQMTNYFKKRVYYVNKLAYEDKNSEYF